MQKTTKMLRSLANETAGFSEYSEETLDTVVFELVVPRAAKVPAARPPFQLVKLAQLTSASSTVPGPVLTELRANNTALGANWCITATLPTPRLSARR